MPPVFGLGLDPRAKREANVANATYSAAVRRAGRSGAGRLRPARVNCLRSVLLSLAMPVF
jgi:hypothetical protein